MRKLLLIVVLAAVLALMVWLNGLAANWHYVVSGEPGELLYTAAFDGFLEEWSLYEGRLSAQVVGDALRITADAPQSGPFSYASPHFADFDLTVQTRAVVGSLDNAYGVIFRLDRKANMDPADDSYYLFLISSDGYYRLKRVVDGEVRVISTWIASPHIRQGVGADAPVNTIRVLADGPDFRFFINGEPVTLCIPDNPEHESTLDALGECMDGEMVEVLVDNLLPSGQVGFAVEVGQMQEPGTVVDFDNVLIYMPE